MKSAIALLLLLTGCGRAGAPMTDLAGAVRAGDVILTAALIARGADPNQPAGGNGWTPLLHAVHTNQLATAEALLAHGADPNRADPGGMTPLMMAAGYGNDEMAALLLRHRADPHVRAHDGATALDYALTGMSDIDKFTLVRCQDSTVALLLRAAPDLRQDEQRTSRAFAALKRCSTG